MNPRSDEELILFLLGACLAMAVLPVLAPVYALRLGATLIEHHVLVEPAAALFTIPYLDAGLDPGRVGILAFVLLLALTGEAYRRRGGAHHG